MIGAGEQREQIIISHLRQAQMILLIISSDYIADDECYQQMEQAMQRKESADIPVIAVLLRSTSHWEDTFPGKLPILPRGERPITKWSNPDTALASVAEDVYNIIMQQSLNQSTDYTVQDVPIPYNHSTILRREQQVKTTYGQLIQPHISAIVITGLRGIGKSTLAAQIYHHTEARRCAGEGPFNSEAVWLHIKPTTTINNLFAKLFAVLDQVPQGIEFLTPYSLANKLFHLLEKSQMSRLIILDQLDEWLDSRTGAILPEYAAMGAWLDALNGHACPSRILITSRLWPQGVHMHKHMCMQKIQLDGLEREEGIALLRLWGIQGSNHDLQRAIERCKGHPLALVLLDNLLQIYHINLAKLLDGPDYQRLWDNDVERNLLQHIYEPLDETQHNLILAFSIYRDAVPWHAAHAVMNVLRPVPRDQTIETLGTLLGYGLLQIHRQSEECYALHPLMVEFARKHYAETITASLKRKMHAEAAHYYQHQLTLQSPSRSRRRSSNDVREQIEAIWHLCYAGQWQQGYALMEQEALFTDLLCWGEHTILIELYTLFSSDQWQPEIKQAAHIQNKLGEVFKRLGRKREAQTCFEKALAFYRTAKTQAGEVQALNNLGAIYRVQKQNEQALKCYQEAIRIGEETQEPVEKGITLNNLGRLFQDMGQNESSSKSKKQKYLQGLVYYEQALVIHSTTGDIAEAARTLNNMGEVHFLLGRSRKAYDDYRRALEQCREIGDKRGEGIVCNHLGTFYRQLEQKQRAFEYCLQALRIFREIGDRGDEAVVLKNLGRLCILDQRNDVALACFLLAQTIYEQLHDTANGTISRVIRTLLTGEKSFEDQVADIAPRAAQIVEKAIDDFMKR